MAVIKLETYRSKRDFSKTQEPAGGTQAGPGNRFVIHRHSATADHYDLRLEHEGVLLSWAVPKGPSLNPAVRRYAVETEPHPIEYIDFEDVIREGQYGAGPMIVWDTGTWAPMGDIAAGLKKGDFKFRLNGQKLSGGWVLVRLKPKPGDRKTNWLLIKEKDAAVDPETDITATRPESVKSGLTVEELRARGARPPAPARPARAAKKPALSRLAGATKAALPAPGTFQPQLATLADKAPSTDGWIHEIKLDGYRTLAHVSGGAVRFVTRGGLDWTDRYGVLAEPFAALGCKTALIDGEVVVVDESGISHFSDLQKALSDKATGRLTFFAFDLVHLDGYDLSGVPLRRRKELLRALVAPVTGGASALHFSDHVEGSGQPLYDSAVELGLEGIISKRADAPYVQARAKTWLKVKAVRSEDFAIVGYTKSAAAGGLGSLALGEWVDGELVYRGNAGTGFDAATLQMLLTRLEPLAAPAQRLARMPKEVIPVRPVLTARIHFADITREGSVRHAVFKGLREPEFTPAEAPAPRNRLITDADLAGIFVTNPTRRLFGRNGPTKLELAVYYAQIGDFMLPHILGRPVTLIRSPSGKADDIFYQRHPFNGMPASVGVFELKKSDDEDRRYLSIEDARGYLALAQFGVVEFHTWGSKRDDIEHPDRATFDLDPGEGVPWKAIVEAAIHVRDELQKRGLASVVKTSGGKGIHVVVPLVKKLDWKGVHEATGLIATEIAAADPDTFTANMAKKSRTRRIYIDWHRNARTATAAAPYSLRARANLPASAPVNWGDLGSIDAPEDLNYSTLPGFVERSGDPWAQIDDLACDLSQVLKRKK